MQAVTVLAVFIVLAFIGVVIIGVALFVRRSQRTKDIERGIKMVPLLLKLPPAETDESQRDDREKIKENISKAEGIFTLLSGLITKRKLYSQRHIAFEIVARGEQIYFYIGVPAALTGAVEKALVAAYPTIQIDQALEHNIFSQQGKIAGVSGGELNLTQKNIYPVQTYKTLEFDPMSGMIASLSKLTQDE